MKDHSTRDVIRIITKRLCLSKIQYYELGILKSLIKKFGKRNVINSIMEIEDGLILAEPILYLRSIMEGKKNKKEFQELISGLDRNKGF